MKADDEMPNGEPRFKGTGELALEGDPQCLAHTRAIAGRVTRELFDAAYSGDEAATREVLIRAKAGDDTVKRWICRIAACALFSDKPIPEWMKDYLASSLMDYGIGNPRGLFGQEHSPKCDRKGFADVLIVGLVDSARSMGNKTSCRDDPGTPGAAFAVVADLLRMPVATVKRHYYESPARATSRVYKRRARITDSAPKRKGR